MTLLSKETLGDRWRRRADEQRAERVAAEEERLARERREDDPSHVAEEVRRVYTEMLQAEVDAVARRRDEIRTTLGGIAAGGSEAVELERERHRLAILEEEALSARPVTTDRDGRPLTLRTVRLVAARAVEMREHLTWQAGRAEAEGDHRRAADLRHNAIRARAVAEYETGLRASLRGYSHAG